MQLPEPPVEFSFLCFLLVCPGYLYARVADLQALGRMSFMTNLHLNDDDVSLLVDSLGISSELGFRVIPTKKHPIVGPAQRRTSGSVWPKMPPAQLITASPLCVPFVDNALRLAADVKYVHKSALQADILAARKRAWTVKHITPCSLVVQGRMQPSLERRTYLLDGCLSLP